MQGGYENGKNRYSTEFAIVTDEEAQNQRVLVRIRKMFKLALSHESTVLLIVLIALIGGMAGITKGTTIATANMRNVLLQSAIRGVASVGQTFVILTAGIDVSVGGIGLFCSNLGAALMTTNESINIVGFPAPIYMAIPIMLVTGMAWGAANGLLVSRIGMPPLIVTLAMWEITKGLTFRIATGFSVGQQPNSLTVLGRGAIAGIPIPVIIFIVTAAIAFFILGHTAFGRSVYAVGGNPVSTWLSGINVVKRYFSVYLISGFCAGIASVLMTARIMSASMQSLRGLELDSIAATVIGGVSLMGGRGSIIGVIAGVLIIGVVNNAMSILGADPAIQGVAKGVIILIAVAIDYVRRRR